MDWLDSLAGGDPAAGIPGWLPLAALVSLVLMLAAAELVWPLHRDQRDAALRIPGNFGIGILSMLLTALLPITGVAAAQWARVEGFGLLNWAAAPVAIAVAATLIMRSLLTYWLHRMAHRTPLLWRMHKVHHSDMAVDLSTGLRHHPLEVLYVAAIGTAAAALLGLSPLSLAIYEVVALAFGLWTHANTSLPEQADRRVALLVMTPAIHHVHHSARQPETDSNYGDVLTLWDRLFGTFRAPTHNEVRAFRFGLGDAHDVGSRNFLVQLGVPFKR